MSIEANRIRLLNVWNFLQGKEAVIRVENDEEEGDYDTELQEAYADILAKTGIRAVMFKYVPQEMRFNNYIVSAQCDDSHIRKALQPKNHALPSGCYPRWRGSPTQNNGVSWHRVVARGDKAGLSGLKCRPSETAWENQTTSPRRPTTPLVPVQKESCRSNPWKAESLSYLESRGWKRCQTHT